MKREEFTPLTKLKGKFLLSKENNSIYKVIKVGKDYIHVTIGVGTMTHQIPVNSFKTQLAKKTFVLLKDDEVFDVELIRTQTSNHSVRVAAIDMKQAELKAISYLINWDEKGLTHLPSYKAHTITKVN